MPRAKDLKELLDGTDPHCKRRGKTIAEFARREAQLDACTEIEKLIANKDEHPDFAAIMQTWVNGTREEVALAAAEYEKR